MARTRRCRNCPEPATPAKAQQPQVITKFTGKTLDPNLVTQQTESARLWNHVLFGTGTCVGMIEGYVSMGLPGDPLPQIKLLINRLVAVQGLLLQQERNADCTS